MDKAKRIEELKIRAKQIADGGTINQELINIMVELDNLWGFFNAHEFFYQIKPKV